MSAEKIINEAESNAVLPLIRQNAFGVYPYSVGFDLANENTLMAVFRTEEQANKFGRMMWGSMFYVEPMDSPHFAYNVKCMKCRRIGTTALSTCTKINRK